MGTLTELIDRVLELDKNEIAHPFYDSDYPVQHIDYESAIELIAQYRTAAVKLAKICKITLIEGIDDEFLCSAETWKAVVKILDEK